jgi:AcrR family transcriptional regulator
LVLEVPTPATETDEAPPIGRRERRKREVRERIFSAARELFAKQGFQATTVDEIAEQADVAPATFFNHFQSKQALLGLMTGEVFEFLHTLTIQHLEGAGSSSEKLRSFIASAADGISANRGVARDVLLEFIRSDASPDGPHPYLQRLIAPFVTLIEEGQSSGEMRTDHNASFLAQMAVGMMNSAITNWLTNPLYPVETGLLEATEFTLSTLSASSTKGRQPAHDSTDPHEGNPHHG